MIVILILNRVIVLELSFLSCFKNRRFQVSGFYWTTIAMILNMFELLICQELPASQSGVKYLWNTYVLCIRTLDNLLYIVGKTGEDIIAHEWWVPRVRRLGFNRVLKSHNCSHRGEFSLLGALYTDRVVRILWFSTVEANNLECTDGT